MEKKEQSRLEVFIETRLEKEGTINAMMDMRLESLDPSKHEVTLLFPVQTWQLNPAGHMHGGMLCTLMDMAMAAAAYNYSDSLIAPTISMSVNFVRGVNANDTLKAVSYCDHAGSRLAQTRVLVYSQTSGKLVASANGSYAMNH